MKFRCKKELISSSLSSFPLLLFKVMTAKDKKITRDLNSEGLGHSLHGNIKVCFL